MRTNIFITNQSVKTTFVNNLDDLNKDLGFVKATSDGNLVDKNFNLVLKEDNYKFKGNKTREIRVIPVSLCDIRVTEHIIDMHKLNHDYCGLSPFELSSDFINDSIGEDVGIRIVIPTEFNHRNSWNFSHRIVLGDTADTITKDLFGQIIASSLKEYVEINMTVEEAMEEASLDIYTNDEHQTIYFHPLDKMPSSAIGVTDVTSIKHISKKFINKLIVDADANYGFDYINCPEGEFYPNKLRYKDAEKLLFEYAKNASNEYTIGLTHIVFNEPRVIDTTGDVVNQVINIIHPVENKGNFVKNDYDTMIGLISE